MTQLALRMDDVGASSKRYEVYSNWQVGLGPIRLSGNWLFLKYLAPFKAWGPYAELDADQWQAICDLLDRRRAKLTVAITAGWAERADRVIPFPERFPRQAAAIKQGVRAGLLEIANHGLTHCVLTDDLFKPHWFSTNRRYHREFWDWVPAAVQADHIQRAQAILQSYFGLDVVTFVPPGNVFTDSTLEIARRHGLRYVSCAVPARHQAGIVVVGDEGILAFHDRDIVLNGVVWLRDCLRRNHDAEFCFVRDVGERLSGIMTDARGA